MVYEELSDRELVGLIVEGNNAAFQVLVKKYSKRLLNIIHSIIKDEDNAYDLLQETMIKIYKNIGQFKGKSSLMTWMTRIAINISFNYLRKFKTSLKYSQSFNDEEKNIEYTFDIKSFVNPEDEVINDLNSKDIQKQISKLDDVHQLTLRLKYYEGFSTKEIAVITQVPEGTVRSRLYYARNYLKERLKPYL